LRNFFPHDEDAKRLYTQTYTLGEFLTKIEYQPPALHRKAVVHGHCHHEAIMYMEGEKSVLRSLELDYELLDSGCCGMAGAFGFEQDKYDVSVKAGERVLLPAVRSADKDTLIIADGFSCHEQVAQLTDRTPLHLAQVVQMALHEPTTATGDAYPEQRYVGQSLRSTPAMDVRRAVGVGAGALLLGGALAWGLRQVRKSLCQQGRTSPVQRD
jgi:hypothetical protein